MEKWPESESALESTATSNLTMIINASISYSNRFISLIELVALTMLWNCDTYTDSYCAAHNAHIYVLFVLWCQSKIHQFYVYACMVCVCVCAKRLDAIVILLWWVFLFVFFFAFRFSVVRKSVHFCIIRSVFALSLCVNHKIDSK